MTVVVSRRWRICCLWAKMVVVVVGCLAVLIGHQRVAVMMKTMIAKGSDVVVAIALCL